MAAICEHCHRGRVFGNAVSHAKNRISRVFKPNLQQLKVRENGHVIRVKLCSSCIQRLKKDGHIGSYRLAFVHATAVVKPKQEMKTSEAAQSEIDKYLKESGILKTAENARKTKEKKAKETVDIAAIVGKKK